MNLPIDLIFLSVFKILFIFLTVSLTYNTIKISSLSLVSNGKYIDSNINLNNSLFLSVY